MGGTCTEMDRGKASALGQPGTKLLDLHRIAWDEFEHEQRRAMRAAEDSRARPAPVRTRHVIPRAKQCVRVCEPGRERCGARCHRWSDGARQQPHSPTCPRDRMRQRRRRRAGGYCADLEASEHRASTRASLPPSPPTQPHGAPPGRARPCARGGLTSRLTASVSPEPVVPARGYVSALET